MTTTFFVPGKPAPQGSKRHVGKGILVESSKECGPWRERVALVAAAEVERIMEKPTPVGMDLTFILPRPASAPKTKTPAATKRPDLDKLERAVLDALTNIAFQDDSQVVSLMGRKRLAEPGEAPGVNVTLFSLHGLLNG